MQFEGEHLLVGKTGHVFVLIAFTASLLSTVSYFLAGRKENEEKRSWIRFGRISRQRTKAS